jgi:hypothetical protein
MNSKKYVHEVAVAARQAEITIQVAHIVAAMNHLGYTTSYGTEYEGGRGSFTLIHATYDWLVAQAKQGDADMVAMTYVKPDGSFAYEKK